MKKLAFSWTKRCVLHTMIRIETSFGVKEHLGRVMFVQRGSFSYVGNFKTSKPKAAGAEPLSPTLEGDQ